MSCQFIILSSYSDNCNRLAISSLKSGSHKSWCQAKIFLFVSNWVTCPWETLYYLPAPPCARLSWFLTFFSAVVRLPQPCAPLSLFSLHLPSPPGDDTAPSVPNPQLIVLYAARWQWPTSGLLPSNGNDGNPGELSWAERPGATEVGYLTEHWDRSPPAHSLTTLPNSSDTEFLLLFSLHRNIYHFKHQPEVRVELGIIACFGGSSPISAATYEPE